MLREAEPEWMDSPDEASAYANADFTQVNLAFVARLLEITQTRKVGWAVDLGTGPGDIPVRIARERAEWHVVGADASFAMLRHARVAIQAAGFCNIAAVRSDAKCLPLRASSMDLVFSNSILHHISDVANLWAEVSRVARSGALVFFRDLYRPASEDAARAIVNNYAGSESPLLQEEYYRSLLSAYTPDEVRAQLAYAGLKDVSVEVITDRHMDIAGPVG